MTAQSWPFPPAESSSPGITTGLDRRLFCKLLGGGIVVLMTSKPADLFAQRRGYPEDLNAYLRIDESGGVTLFSGKIEMGQGVHTSLAQMAAEELGVSLDSITMVMGDTDLCPWDAGTWGSQSTRMFGPAVRAAAAEARAVLMKLASEKLGSPKEHLVVENGVVSNGSQKVTYGELAKGKQIARLVGEKAVLRTVKQFKAIGTPAKRMDAHEKVTGRAKYAGDIRVPGMLYARILRPPMHGATRKSLDTSKAKAMSGVTVVEHDDLVAALHADPEGAREALALIKAEWNRPAAAFDTESVADYFVKNGGDGEAGTSHGDVTSTAAGARVFQSTFRTGYLAHAPMETHTALAEWKDGKMTVWASTQSPFGARTRIANVLGLEEKSVRVITPFVGGGFGGKSPTEQGVEAAQLAKITGKPVAVVWTRAEEFFFDTFGPASVIKINSSIDDAGKMTMWDYHVYAAGGSSDVLYDVPNVRVKTYLGRRSGGENVHPFATGPWRAPGAGPNVFARESQIDIMAAAAKIDPLDLRLRNASDERLRRVLKAAADAFGWKAGPGPSGQGRAIAVALDVGTYCAIAAEVAVDRKTGAINVKRVVAAQDMGLVINPWGAKMQMSGCINMGLGYVLSEELKFNGGDILDKNFDTYELPRFAAVAPHIETVLIKNDDLAPQGGGEPAIVPMGAVIANAVFDATGVRMYRLPMTPERVLAAIKQA